MEESIKEIFNMVKSEGGITANLYNPNVKITNGYAVAIKGHEKRIPFSKFNLNSLKDYIMTNLEALKTSNTYLGVWIDNCQNEVHMDVSSVKKSFLAAMLDAIHKKDVAIYSFQDGIEYRTSNYQVKLRIRA